MKLNKISMVIAAVAFVGCSSDDFDLSSNKTVEDAQMVQLNPNFVIAGVGEEGAATRTHWEWDDPVAKTALVNKFLPIYASAPAADLLSAHAKLDEQAVGLCWLGQNGGEKVYTNYEFYHYGWLKNGATKAEIECDELTNGAYYNEINVAAGGAAGDEADPADFSLAVAKTFAIGALNYNTGVYKTENKAIFGGQYIVYYPYNKDFKDAGTIPAIAETKFNNVSQNFDTKEIGKATFRYSAPVKIDGGEKAADFGLNNLSSIVQLRVATPAGDAAIGKFIDQIVLYSAKEQLLKQANLAADKIAAGQKGAALYDSKVGTKTIVANFAAPVALAATNTAAPISAFITALPTTVEDLVVLVHRTDGKWARIDQPNTEFVPGKAKYMNMTVANGAWTSDYIAVDEASLTQALTDARAAIAADPTGTLRPSITVIGEITLASAAYDIAQANDWKITISGDAIIVPQDVKLDVAANMVSDIRVLGKSCCTGAAGGRLEIKGGTVNNVTMEPTQAAASAANNPEVTFSTAKAIVAASKTFDAQAGNVIVNAPVEHKGDIKIAAGVTLTVNPAGDLNFMGGSVLNNGTIEVKKNGKFDMTAADGSATATDGQRMTNNGKFIHNVDAGVGTAVQSMVQNGEYRCRVDEQTKLDDAFLQWTACSVIEMVNGGAYTYNLGTAESITPAAYKHNNKYINIEVNAGGLTTFDNPVVSGKPDNKEIQIGNLDVNAGGLDIIYADPANFVTVAGVKYGLRTLTVNGNMTVKANTTITNSKKINVTENLTVDGAAITLTYAGNKANIDGLAVTKDITIKGNTADFNAGAIDALNITCANFYLKSRAQAEFGNRTEGDTKNLVVTGTIDNPTNCTFNILAANQNGAGSVLAWVTCSQLKVGGNWGAARPRVQ